MQNFLNVLDGGFERSRGRGVFHIIFGCIMVAASGFFFYESALQPSLGRAVGLLGLILLLLGIEGLARGTVRLLNPDQAALITALRLVGILAWVACLVTLTVGVYLYFGLISSAIFVVVVLAIWVLSRLISRGRGER